jgi:hypothetical protein
MSKETQTAETTIFHRICKAFWELMEEINEEDLLIHVVCLFEVIDCPVHPR